MELQKWQSKKFEDIRHFDEYGNEYWLARELQEILAYAKWENFHKVIKQAMISCKVSRHEVSDHFPDVRKTVYMPIGGKAKVGFPDAGKTESKTKSIQDYKLTRYACYLIVMNGDPRKEVISFGQMYFAVKTREQELRDIYDRLNEDERRLFLRVDIKQKNMLLANAAKRAGIQTYIEYATFQDFGYKGLYGGETAGDIALRKGLADSQEILDHMGSEELGANLFRITQTEALMKKNNTDNIADANRAHYRVGKAVRQTIIDLGTTLPEDLPTPEKSIPQLQREQIKQIEGKKTDEE